MAHQSDDSVELRAQPTRKQVTVALCDIVGYTARSVRLDPEELAVEVRAVQEICAACLHKHGGRIVNYSGDGILMLFGHPLAGEFDAQNAVRAALEIGARIEADGARIGAAAHTDAVQIRIGVATGIVMAGQRGVGAHADGSAVGDEMLFGEAPNLADRLQQLAQPNGVVVALRTRRLVGSAFVFRDLGECAVKGFVRPVRAWRAVRMTSSYSRPALLPRRVTTRFVGRADELTQLHQHFAHARAGRGRAVLVCGEAGIGKSRLVRTFEKAANSFVNNAANGIVDSAVTNSVGGVDERVVRDNAQSVERSGKKSNAQSNEQSAEQSGKQGKTQSNKQRIERSVERSGKKSNVQSNEQSVEQNGKQSNAQSHSQSHSQSNKLRIAQNVERNGKQSNHKSNKQRIERSVEQSVARKVEQSAAHSSRPNQNNDSNNNQNNDQTALNNFNRLRIYCSHWSRLTPFKPIIDETHRWLQIGADDADAIKREAIQRRMAAIGLSDADEHILFAEMLSLEAHRALNLRGGEKHRRMVDALATIVIRLSRLQPLLLMVEDLHFADSATLEVVGSIIARATSEKLLLVLSSRNNALLPRGLRDVGALFHLRLGGLDETCAAQLIDDVFNQQPPPQSAVHALIKKGGGVPMFLEESSWYLRDQMHEQLREQFGDQLDEVNMAGWCVAREEVAPYNAHPPDSFGELFDVPDTLQDYLNARLDSLGDAKPIAQIAAVFGGDFRYEWIDAVAKQNHLDADAAMDELSAQDIVSIRADNTEDRYEFRHSLFQEAAYHSLLKKTRKLYHRQIAELLSQQGEGKQRPELLAHHYAHTDAKARAVDLWLGAGRRAITRAMLHDALAHIERGRRLLGSLPNGARRKRRELELLLNRAVALTAGAGYHGDAVTSAYQRALLLANDAGTERQTWAALYGLWRCRVSQARFADALRLLTRLKMLCRQSRDAKLELTTCGLQAMTRMVAGKFGAAERFYNRAVALYDASRDKNMGVRFGQDPYLTIRGLGAVNKLLRNQLSESLDEIACSVDAARAVGHPYTIAETLRVAAMYRQIAGDLDGVRAAAAETARLADAHQFAGLGAAGRMFLAFCDAVGAQNASAAQVMETHLASYRRNYGELFLPYFHALLAQTHAALGNYDSALSAAQNGQMLAIRFGEQWYRAPLFGIKARVAQAGKLCDAAQINDWRRQGRELANAQGAHFALGFLRE